MQSSLTKGFRMTRKRKIRRMRSLHVSDIYKMVKSGDDDAIEFLIDMQQKGRHLRYYPDGRSGIHDFGVVPASMSARKGCVEIRSGRPDHDLLMDKDTCFAWIIGIPKCIAECLVGLQEDGYDLKDAHLEMDLRSDHEHDFRIWTPAEEWEDDATVSIYPRGSARWRLGFYDAGILLQEMCELCKDMGWEYEEDIDDSELESIAAVIRKIDEY